MAQVVRTHARVPARRRLRALAMLAGLAVAGAVVQAPAQASAAPVGKVCMFSAPNVIVTGLSGHVGWAFQTGPDRWTFGSYSPNGKEWKSGWTWAATVGYFKAARPGYFKNFERYRAYRCKNTHRMSSAAALQTWKNYPRFNGFSSNCLTSATAIFRAYSSPDLRNLPSANGTAPRIYFSRTLGHYGFGGAQPL